MFNQLKALCEINAPSGCEINLRKYIIKQISPYCEYWVDKMGNIIALKKGKKSSSFKLMIDAHMDEVGIIITYITSDGFLKFQTLGGISAETLLCRTVTIKDSVMGVIGSKPIHLTSGDEGKKMPDISSLYIDVGCSSREEAEKLVSVGDCGVLNSNTEMMSDTTIKAKALDDRAGCFALIELIKSPSEYDFYATFTVQEELGCRGAKTASFSVAPDFAIILEATTAADISGVPEEKQVCVLGNGPAVSFMDGGAVYDRTLYNLALNSGIRCQSKSSVTGGNNASSIHLSRSGVRCLALSVPCRYIHSPSCVSDLGDIKGIIELSKYMINKICSGEI